MVHLRNMQELDPSDDPSGLRLGEAKTGAPSGAECSGPFSPVKGHVRGFGSCSSCGARV